MASKGTAGFGLVVAAALIIFAILAPGSPERPTPSITGITGSGLLTQRAAYGAALGAQTGTATLTGVPTQAEIEKLISEYLAQATEDVKAQLGTLLAQNVAGAKADIQAQISGIAAQFAGQGISPDQLVAALRGSLASSSGGGATTQLSNLLAPYVRSALAAPSGGKAPAAPRAPAAAPAPAPAPPSGFGNLNIDPPNFSDSGLKSSMDSMDSKMGDMDMNMNMDMD